MPDLRQARGGGVPAVLLRALQAGRPQPLAQRDVPRSRAARRRHRGPAARHCGRRRITCWFCILLIPWSKPGPGRRQGWTRTVIFTKKPRSASGRTNSSPDLPPDAQVAQLVEHVTENHGVGGSIPPLGTTTSPIIRFPGLFASDWPTAGTAVEMGHSRRGMPPPFTVRVASLTRTPVGGRMARIANAGFKGQPDTCSERR